MYDGTLGGDWKALITFQQFLILSDAEGYLDLTPDAIHRVTSIPLEIILEGIEKLSAPDPNSRTITHEGRRIIPIDPDRKWGWVIVNKKKYMEIASYEDKKERERIRIAEKRKHIKDVANRCSVLPNVANVAQVEVEVEVEVDRELDLKKRSKSFLSDSIEIGLSSFLFELIKKRNPRHKAPNMQLWAQQISLMIRIDKRDPVEIRKVIEASQADEFWQNNILSTQKLRKQYDQLILKT